MANLTQNLELLRLGKQNLIDKINTKLVDSDKEILSIDCEWDDIINLLSKIRVKRDHSAEIDTNAIYTDLCEGTFNTEIVTAVTTIMPYAMYGQTYLPKITGENVISIGTYAFDNCINLTDVIFPNVTTINDYAFYNCSKLTNTNFSKATFIGNYGFNGCGFESIDIPKIITINSYGFSNCNNLKTIVLNLENTYTIGNSAFNNCPSLETDVTVNATSIGSSAISNTKIIDINSDTVTSIGNEAIKNNSELEQISFSNVTNIDTTICLNNPKLQSILLPNVTRISGGFSNNASLELVYAPNITEFRANNNPYTSIFTNCPKITSISWPNALYNSYSSYQGYSGLVLDCPGLTTVDLSSMKYWCTYYSFADNKSAWFINNAKALQNINLSSLEYTHPTYQQSASNAYNRTALLFNRVGCDNISLPNLKYWYASDYAQLFTNCYNLTSLNLPNLVSVFTNSRDPNNYKCAIISGCPNLLEIELPALEKALGNGIFGASNQRPYNDSTSAIQEQLYAQDAVYQKKYIENMLEYYKFRYPTDYNTKTDYIRYYERLHGGLKSVENFETADPWNDGIQSRWGYNQAWCGLKKISLPKLQQWVSYLCYYTTELEELYLGDGTFTPTTITLPNYFIANAWNLRKVVLNYPVVLKANSALTTIFSNCPHLNGSRYETTNYNGQHWYHANPEQLQDLYFYVPDNLVNDYKAATNWSTYADQIRPISELSDTVIDSSITSIESEEYKDNQELNTIAGYGITTIGTNAFNNSSVTRAEFPLAENISSYAFAECQNLVKVTLAFSKINTIADGTFKNTAITEANYPNAIAINKQAFYGCQDLNSILIPKCEIIYDDAFNDANLAVLSASELKTIGNNVFKNNSLESLTLPKIVTIGNNAFEDNVLTSLSLDTLTTIGNNTFKNNNLTSISFANLTSIGANAFEDNNITSVNIPKIAIIKDNAFKDNTNLTSINLASVVALGSNVFNGCQSLTDITFEGYIVPTVGENTIKSTYILHVRPEMVDGFQEAFPNNTVVGDVS